MFVLFVSELNYYLTTEVHPELFVDISRGQKLKINIDITFPRVSCTCKYKGQGFRQKKGGGKIQVPNSLHLNTLAS
jgi:hypothetical protein